MRSTFSDVMRSLYVTTSTSGFSASSVFFAESAFHSPSRSVECAIWRCRFEASTRSSSTMPSRPTPASKIKARRTAEAAGADQEHARLEQLELALDADLGDEQVAAVARALCRIERARQRGREAVALPVGVAARERDDVLVAEVGE